jgi:8-oxo-dGTP diphosphatase
MKPAIQKKSTREKAVQPAAPSFGFAEPGVEYVERRAAYVVVMRDDLRVAVVRTRHGCFLPGGDSLLGEAPTDTVIREVLEELGRGLRLTGTIGTAIQYFYAGADDCHYLMLALFFTGEFTSRQQPGVACEHELEWLPLVEAEGALSPSGNRPVCPAVRARRRRWQAQSACAAAR